MNKSWLHSVVIILAGLVLMIPYYWQNDRKSSLPPDLIINDSFSVISGQVRYSGGSQPQLLSLNPNSLVVFNQVFVKDDSQVYCCQMDCQLLTGAEPSTFSTYQIATYAHDHNRVYNGCQEITATSPNTFRPLNVNYYISNGQVYFNGQLLANVSPAEFIPVSDEYGLAGDRVYFHEQVIEADAATFKVIDSIYARDTQRIYVQSRPIDDVEVGSFRVLASNYATDNRYVYMAGQVISQADPGSFQVLDEFYQKDASRVYFQGQVIAGAKPNLFRVLGSGRATDDEQIYVLGQPLKDQQ